MFCWFLPKTNKRNLYFKTFLFSLCCHSSALAAWCRNPEMTLEGAGITCYQRQHKNCPTGTCEIQPATLLTAYQNTNCKASTQKTFTFFLRGNICIFHVLFDVIHPPFFRSIMGRQPSGSRSMAVLTTKFLSKLSFQPFSMISITPSCA